MTFPRHARGKVRKLRNLVASLLPEIHLTLDSKLSRERWLEFAQATIIQEAENSLLQVGSRKFQRNTTKLGAGSVRPRHIETEWSGRRDSNSRPSAPKRDYSIL